MLDLIRSNSQSLAVKIAFGIIILVFVFWGVGNLVDTGSVNLIGKVNGSPITYVEFERRYMQAEEDFLRRSPNIKRENLREMGLGRHIFDRMVVEKLLQHEADRVGITITGLELRQMVANIPAFQKDEKFDPEAYKRVLAAQRTTPARFESGLATELLQEKLQRLMGAAAYVDPTEVRTFFDIQNERRVVDYIAYPATDFMAAITIQDADVKKFYDEHKNTFAIPAKVELEYLTVSPETLVKPESIGEEQISAWYDKNKERFAVPEQRLVSHILIKLAENASKEEVKKAEETIQTINNALAKGQSFATLAEKYSDDQMSAQQGGKLGWISRGQTVPPFEEVAFSAEKGKVSKPVRSQFGIHLLLVEDSHAAGIQALEDVKDLVRKELANTEGSAKLREVLDSLVESSLLGKPLAEAGAAFNLVSEQSNALSLAELQSMGLNAKDAESVMNTPAGVALNAPLEAGDNRFMLIKVLKSQPAGTESFESVKTGITQRLRKDAAIKAAMTKAVEERKNITDGGNLPDNLKNLVKTSPSPMTRQGGFASFLPDAALTTAIFHTGKDLWLPAAYTVSNAQGENFAVLVRVNTIIASSDKDFAQWQDMLSNAMLKKRQEVAFQLFLASLLKTAKVEILNPDVINRKEAEARQ